jgi:hypothetical protein
LGIVADDVQTVTVKRAGGKDVNVPVTHGAFVWTAPSGTEVDGLTLTRDGVESAVAPAFFS